MGQVRAMFVSYAHEDMRQSRDAKSQLLGRAGRLVDLRADLTSVSSAGHRFIFEAKNYLDADTRDTGELFRLLLCRAMEEAAPAESSSPTSGLQPPENAQAFASWIAAARYLVNNRRKLPVYAVRPYLPQSCCFGVVATLPDADTLSAADLALLAAYAPMPPTVHLAVTFRDQRQFQDYRAGLVQLVDAQLLLLARVLVMLLAAFARRTMAPVFLLVMLSTVRHFGHRSEPDHLSPPVFALTFHQGSVRLAA